jgi:hypothetical protein
MTVQIPAEQRDALYASILVSFDASEDLDRAIATGDLERAYKVGRKISDGLRLILDGGLGFASQTAGPSILKLPAEELRGIVSRMKAEADAVWDRKRPEREETRREWAEITDVQEACTSILGQIEP